MTCPLETEGCNAWQNIQDLLAVPASGIYPVGDYGYKMGYIDVSKNCANFSYSTNGLSPNFVNWTNFLNNMAVVTSAYQSSTATAAANFYTYVYSTLYFGGGTGLRPNINTDFQGLLIAKTTAATTNLQCGTGPVDASGCGQCWNNQSNTYDVTTGCYHCWLQTIDTAKGETYFPGCDDSRGAGIGLLTLLNNWMKQNNQFIPVIAITDLPHP